MRRTVLLMILLSAFLSTPAFGLDIIDQDPHFDTFMIHVEEGLSVVFDASLDPATATPENVILRRVDTDQVVPVDILLADTNRENDTLNIVPQADLRFGKRYRIGIEPGLSDVNGTPFSGQYPMGRDFVPNIPRDMQFPTCAPDDMDCLTDLTNPYMGFNPIDPEGTDTSKIYTIPGVSVTEAWKWATGRPDVIIAVIDDGMSDYNRPDLRDRLFLNRGELPIPQNGGLPCGDYDCNGDGRFSASDFGADPRVLAFAGADPVNVGHLLAAFSDGTDADGNGYVDDISGYDFFRDVNEVLGVVEFPEGTHGDGAENVAGEAENGEGNKIGFCPNCTVLPIRVSDAVVADYNLMAAAADYANDMGVKIICVALGSFNTGTAAHQAFVDAYDNGILTIAAGGDELGMHHLWPAAGEDVLNVTALFPFPPVRLFNFFPMEWIAFTESYCTNYGAHTDISMPAGHICTSEATQNTAGSAGLIVSRARDLGIELSANELKQIMTLSADDIKERCVSLVEGPSMGGTCREGWDQHFGYGRLNVKKAFDMLGYPELGIPAAIPAEARIMRPLWWRVFSPAAASNLLVEGQMSSRVGAYSWEIQAASGVQPYDRDFEVLASGEETAPVNGPIATVDVTGVMLQRKWARPPQSANDKTITLRLRVWYEQDGETIYGEARKALQLQQDDHPETGLVSSFPIELAASVEASPRLVDLDGDPDGRLEILIATSGGLVEVYKYDQATKGWGQAEGFPVDLSGDNPRFADGILGAPAVGDLFGDGLPKIVVATKGGLVYALHHDGNRHPGGAVLAGFPVQVDTPANTSPFEFGHGNAILASPALADLDLDGVLDIIVGSYEQKAYAWRPWDEDQDGEADLLPGWPVLLSSAPGLVDPDKECHAGALPAQVLGSPAVGILAPNDADPNIAEHPAVVIPVSEICENEGVPMGRIYAIYWNGYENSRGPFLPGWPAKIPLPLGDAIPLPPITTGVTNSPAVWIDPAGEARILVGGFLWFPQVIRYDGQRTRIASYVGSANLTTTSNGTFAHLRGDDSMQLLIPTMGPLNKIDGQIKLESWNIVGFDVDRPGRLVFRQRWEDIQFFVNPIVADISGDNLPEVIAGSGGFNVHAYDIHGNEAEDWPKATHNWAIASVAVGDMDRDGLLEVVLPTHEGMLFAWETRGRECIMDRANSDWRTFHHDEHSTGFYGSDTLPPRMIVDLDVTRMGNGTFELSFPAAGDDLGCGIVQEYEVRYSKDPAADLRPLDDFLAAEKAWTLPVELVAGGERQRLRVEAPQDAAAFSLRGVDDEGLLAWPSVTALAHDPVPDEDDDAEPTDDDGQEEPEESDAPFKTDGDEQECGCGN